MLGIVLADNFVMMFIFWELVGVSSYLLIGFWYETGRGRRTPGKKAFLTNRIGDFGFLLGILLVWVHARPPPELRGIENLTRHRSSHEEKFAGGGHRGRPADFLRRNGQSPRNSRCTSGCPTRWKAPRRSAR